MRTRDDERTNTPTHTYTNKRNKLRAAKWLSVNDMTLFLFFFIMIGKPGRRSLTFFLFYLTISILQGKGKNGNGIWQLFFWGGVFGEGLTGKRTKTTFTHHYLPTAPCTIVAWGDPTLAVGKEKKTKPPRKSGAIVVHSTCSLRNSCGVFVFILSLFIR
ncbi:hypothetical protein F5X99DRAFT_398168 [Biscogniauxia marginata]|nr:hypothetical protein F5X99DRAFT_398168 [Biscogniauxia marginata]